MKSATETRRALAYLRDLVEDSDIPRSEIERRLAFSRGYLSQLLTGSIDLKLWQLIAILDTLGKTPAKFFSELFPRPRPAPLPTRRKPRTAGGLTVTRDVVLVYGFGIDAIRDLGRRLERCEKALTKLHRTLNPPGKEGGADGTIFADKSCARRVESTRRRKSR